MRKHVIAPQGGSAPLPPDADWLDLEHVAQAELSSEDPTHPIENALQREEGDGWRASEAGEQTVRLFFDTPHQVKRIILVFREEEHARTQEFLLRWSADGRTYRDIVRQQYNFSPPHTTGEVEDYSVELAGLTSLELKIVPDVSGGSAHASLAHLGIAGSPVRS